MRYLVIINPAANSARASKRLGQIRRALENHLSSFEIVVTEKPGDGIDVIRRQAAAFDAVVAVGGDGTVNEVACGIIQSGRALHLGVVPVGTGNDFVKMIGVPLDIDASIAGLATYSSREIDYGTVSWNREGAEGSESFFLNAAGIGFDAAAAADAVSHKTLPGVSGYLWSVLRTMYEWKSPHADVVASDAAFHYSGPTLLVTVGNGKSSGGGFLLTPDASVTDGLFDICIVEAVSKLRTIAVLPSALRGRHVSRKEVHVYRAGHVAIELDRPVPVHVDGEIIAMDAFQIEIGMNHLGISVLCPI